MKASGRTRFLVSKHGTPKALCSAAVTPIWKRSADCREIKTHLTKLKGGNNHEHDTPKAEVESIAVGQAGVRLPLYQLEHRVDDYHGSPQRSMSRHSFKTYRL